MAGEKRYQFAFSGKEIFVIFSMLFFIVALLFTLGLMFGKTGGFNLGSLASIAGDSGLDDEFDDELDNDLDNRGDIEEGDVDEGEDFADEEEIGAFEKASADKKEERGGEGDKVAVAGGKEKGKDSSGNLPEDSKLSFYKDLTGSEKSSDKVGTKKKRRYPMISEEVLISNRGKYTVQVAAYAREVDAESKTLLLKKSCCPGAYYVESEVPGKGIWYQVRIGFFDKLTNAKAFAMKLKRQKRIAEYVIKVVR